MDKIWLLIGAILIALQVFIACFLEGIMIGVLVVLLSAVGGAALLIGIVKGE